MDLQEELDRLQIENARLYGKVQELQHENNQLKEQLIILNSN